MDVVTYALLNGKIAESGSGSSGTSGGVKVTLAENASGGVNLTVGNSTKTLAKQEAVKGVDNKVTALNATVTDLQKTNAKKDAAQDDAITTLQQDSASAKEQLSTLNTSLQIKGQTLTSLSNTVDSLASSTTQNFSDINAAILEQDAAIAELQTSVGKVDSLEKKINTNTQVTGQAITNINTNINGLKDQIKTIQTSITEKSGIQNFVFEDLADMNLWLEDEINVAKLAPGSNLYIKAYDVADYWWDGKQVQPLETEKVDLSAYVKNTDYATNRKVGLVQGSTAFGIDVNNSGVLKINPADEALIAAGVDTYNPVTSATALYAVFYGLAKAAGVDAEQISSSHLIYSDEALAAIQNMLGLGRKYVTQDEYDALKAFGMIEPNLDYFIVEG